jgi:hypothetical protein
VLNENLLSTSVVAYMLEGGLAVAVAAGVSAGFFALGAYVAYYREKHPERLANFSSRFTTFTISAIPGFSVGADFFLILGIWQTAPALAIAMLLLGHCICLWGCIWACSYTDLSRSCQS